MAEGMAEIAQEPSADRPEDPLMQWAVAERAILVTNRKFGDQLSAYQVPAQREACREWSRSCTLTWAGPGSRVLNSKHS